MDVYISGSQYGGNDDWDSAAVGEWFVAVAAERGIDPPDVLELARPVLGLFRLRSALSCCA